MTAVIHFRSNAIVTTDMRTTPAATSRADTSLTGLGKENNERITPTRLVGYSGARTRACGSACGWHRLGRRRPHVAGGRADEAVVRRLLEHVRAPPDGPARRERRGEHLAGDA